MRHVEVSLDLSFLSKSDVPKRGLIEFWLDMLIGCGRKLFVSQVFCYQQGVMYAALIHRAVRNLVLIELSCDTTPNPPLMFPIGLVALLTLFFAYQVLLTIR